VDHVAAFPGEIAWVDGAVVPRERAALPLSDAGFVLGATVTEQLRTFGGELFLPEPHAARMRDSLEIVGTDPGRPLAEIFAAAAAGAPAQNPGGTATSA
jgi:branched-subunit amino acid aminotransferase/4-amino-4-deoxychorismate lyase